MPIFLSTGSFWLWFDYKYSHKAFDRFNDNALLNIKKLQFKIIADSLIHGYLSVQYKKSMNT